MTPLLNFDNAYKAFQQIETTHFKELKTSLYRAAIRYAHIRAEWEFMDHGERNEIDQERTVAHNRFIDSCNILVRNQKEKNEDTSWGTILKKDRKLIGDLACYLHFFIGINNR